MNGNFKIDAHLACVRDDKPEKFYFFDKKTNTLLNEINDVSQFDKKTVSITYFKNNKIQSLYTGQVNERCCPNGIGKDKGKDWEYVGGWKDGKKHGQGIKYKIEPFDGYNDIKKVLAKGEWKEDKLWNGKGELKVNNSMYIGEIKEGKLHGQGFKIVYGFWNGKWKEERKYTGGWKSGQMYGKGLIKNKLSGNKFHGEWDGNGYAQGRWSYKSGSIYTGRVHGELLDGKGTMKYANGDVYEGEWKNDKKQGQGTMIYKNGDKYEGEWVKGEKQGQGTMIYKNGDKYEGEWVKGEKQGKGTMKYANGDVYEGEWKNDKKQGQGTMIYKNGDVYEGFWKNDKKQGVGKFTSKKLGTIYEGDWLDGWINGYGKITDKEGNSKTVLFEKGGLEEIEKTIPIQCDNIVEQENKNIKNNADQNKEDIDKEKQQKSV